MRKMNWKLLRLIITSAIAVAIWYIFLSYGNNWAEVRDYVSNGATLLFFVAAALTALNILAMYYAAGKIWHPYFKDEGLSAKLLGRIQYELCYVNAKVPFLDMMSGKDYAKTRLGKLGVTEEKAAAMYEYRYIISIITKWIEIGIGIVILTMLDEKYTSGWAGTLVIAVTIGLLTYYAVRLVYCHSKIGSSKKKPSDWCNAVVLAFDNPKALASSFGWGMIYSLLEVTPYLIVGAYLGHPETFLVILVTSGLGIAAGGVALTPMGLGGFEVAVALLAWGMGLSPTLVFAVAALERIFMMAVTGWTSKDCYESGSR